MYLYSFRRALCCIGKGEDWDFYIYYLRRAMCPEPTNVQAKQFSFSLCGLHYANMKMQRHKMKISHDHVVSHSCIHFFVMGLLGYFEKISSLTAC